MMMSEEKLYKMLTTAFGVSNPIVVRELARWLIETRCCSEQQPTADPATSKISELLPKMIQKHPLPWRVDGRGSFFELVEVKDAEGVPVFTSVEEEFADAIVADANTLSKK